MPSTADIRQTYQKFELLESSAAADPYEQFDRWFQQALHSEVPEPTAMTLATADTQARPSARTVLLKGYDHQGFVFFTNYESRKGQELEANPQASLLFFWEPLERQVRIEGRVSRILETESDAYYDSRPLGSRIGAWASPQSRPINHDDLADRVRELTLQLGDHPERPPFWGGFRLRAERVEFWQGRPSRLHDRLVYTPAGDGTWTITRIAP
ncbi:MAG: pyridoxamine 5'-phosphate oxidase [Castellaniella sp.]|uniref:pyridoxamine 5'-phosphate oxidase n=1 Tax=Castellaniella sp. TaxID=1955812 RepID=UPI00120573C1|nr:pyridoxamine 5'-phosphate oxidase [Castellaniella sp.]TAN29711.1 MAG: pyridoxamine 5'-phosphate oxidase [Castellaniella sp.]